MQFRNIILSALLLPASLITKAQDFRFNEVSYTPRRTVFRLFAPTQTKRVVLNIYAHGDAAADAKPLATKRMRRVGKDLWAVELKGDQ